MDAFTKNLDRQIGQRLRTTRLMLGLSQTLMGKMVGVSFRQVQKYESGINGLSPARMIRYAESLGVTVNYILGVGETELPHVQTLMRLWQALQRIKLREPATFKVLHRLILNVAESKNG